MNDSGEKLRILAVDDEESVREFLASLMRHRGDDFRIAESGFQALSILDKEDFDVLITDLYMPLMNGHELIRRARGLRPEMICIVLTGLGTTRDPIAAIKEGVYDYIEKPIKSLPAFSLAIDRAGARAHLIRERNRLMADLQRQNKKLEANLRSLNEAYEKLMRQEEALENDLRQAQRMQQSLLPAGFPRVEGVEFFGYYHPCEPLGGDFFDVIAFGNGRAALYLADVSGHGVRAAMITVITRELIHAERMLHPENDVFEHPAKALAFLNRALFEEEFDPPLHVTMGYAMIDSRNGRVAYSGAGHPRPIVVAARKPPESLAVDGPALGVEQAPVFGTVHVSLKRGDVFLLYSDGLSEARNPAGAELTDLRLLELAAQCHGLAPRVIGEKIEQTLLAHQQSAPVSDDASFVVFSRMARAGEAKDEIEPSSIKIVDIGAIHAPAPTAQGRIEAGWAGDTRVIRIAGRVTWEQGPALCALVKEAEDGGAGSVCVDLSDCESLDSTMLGILHQFRHAASQSSITPAAPGLAR